MRYVLSDKIALRSWKLVPYGYYVWGSPYPKGLDAASFELLSRCDGATDLVPSPELGHLERLGFIRPALDGEAWSDWSRPRAYRNRVFHSLNWAVTGKCNFNCRHCFMAADNAPMMGEFTWDECLALLDECERCGIQNVTLTGGEPMLHPRFMDLVRECARRGLFLSDVNTNGSLLTAEALDELARLGFGGTTFKVSFDGIGHHDWLRGVPHAEEKALAAMRLAREKGFPVCAQTNVHRANLGAMDETLRTLEGIGVDRVRIIRTTETPRWRRNGGDATLGIVEYYDEMLALIDRCVQADLGIEVDVWQFAHYWPRLGAYAFHPVQIQCGRYRDTTPACKGARGEVAVSHTGEVHPCNQMSGTMAAMGVSLGNVKETPLHELLEAGPYYDAVTLPVAKVREHNAVCRDCAYWEACAGGCRAVAMALTKDYRHYDPAKCAFFKGGYMAKLDEVFARAPRPYRGLDDTGAMDRAGEPDAMEGVLAQLGPYA